MTNNGRKNRAAAEKADRRFQDRAEKRKADRGGLTAKQMKEREFRQKTKRIFGDS